MRFQNCVLFKQLFHFIHYQLSSSISCLSILNLSIRNFWSNIISIDGMWLNSSIQMTSRKAFSDLWKFCCFDWNILIFKGVWFYKIMMVWSVSKVYEAYNRFITLEYLKMPSLLSPYPHIIHQDMTMKFMIIIFGTSPFRCESIVF